MIVESSPFFRENFVAEVKIAEASEWVDELIVVEANMTFKGRPKDYCFEHATQPPVRYVKMDAKKSFTTRSFHVQRKFPFLGKRAYPWVNEERQRNHSMTLLDPEPSDVLIFSDIDEIIDSRSADRIIDETHRRGIVTMGLYVNTFFLNVFDFNWQGPPNFTYRVFAMTGDYYRKMRVTPDSLRKAGEDGKLVNDVYSIPGYQGFHLSWIGDSLSVATKMTAFAHEPEHFISGLYRPDGTVDDTGVADAMRVLHHPMSKDWPLVVRDDIPLLSTVESLRDLPDNGNLFYAQ